MYPTPIKAYIYIQIDINEHHLFKQQKGGEQVAIISVPNNIREGKIHVTHVSSYITKYKHIYKLINIY